MSNMYYVVCEETGEEDVLEANSSKEAILEFAKNKEIDRWEEEERFNTIEAVKLF